jgi:hypothetical protein
MNVKVSKLMFCHSKFNTNSDAMCMISYAFALGRLRFFCAEMLITGFVCFKFIVQRCKNIINYVEESLYKKLVITQLEVFRLDAFRIFFYGLSTRAPTKSQPTIYIF